MSETVEDVLNEMDSYNGIAAIYAQRLRTAISKQTTICQACTCELLTELENENEKLKEQVAKCNCSIWS